MSIFMVCCNCSMGYKGVKNVVIYQPRLAFDLRAALLSGVVQALELALLDFVSQDNKPWAYYVGAALGYSAAATGIPNATATMYVVGQTVDLALLHSEDGSDVQLFLNGVLYTTVDTYTAAGNSWGVASIALIGGLLNRIDIVNAPSTNGAKTSAINWLGLGAVTINGTGAELRTRSMAYDVITFHAEDAEGGRQASYPYRVAAGQTRAQLQTVVNTVAPLLDAVTAAKLASVDVLLALDIPAGVKANPNALSMNERGGLITFSTTGPRRDSIWIPAILPSIAPGEGEFALTNAAVAALVADIIANARTANDYAFLAAQRASRSVRK